jgi:hypothetical protein
MQAQLIARDGSIIPLDDEQYRQVLKTLGLDEPAPTTVMSPQEADALLDELEGISASWGFSTDDLLEERRRERQLEQRREA